jgi:hypothetical protein
MPDKDAKKTTDQELKDVSAGAAFTPDAAQEGPAGGGGGGGGQGPSWQSNHNQEIDAQNVDAGTAQPRDISVSGPGGGGSNDGSSFQPQQIDPNNIDAGMAQPNDIGPGPSGGGGPDSQSIPPFIAGPGGPGLEQLGQGDASGIAAGATEPPDHSSHGGSDNPGPSSTPSIKIRVQDTDLTGGAPNADV